MKTVAGVFVVLVLLAPQVVAASADSMTVGGVTLTLGMPQQAVVSQLPANWRLGWQRDRLPQPVTATKSAAGVRYEGRAKGTTFIHDDDYGDHGFVANAAGEPVVFVVFEGGKLTRATRLVGGANEDPAKMVTTVASALESWGTPAKVRATHDAAGLDEVVFESGSRQLIILSTGGRTQVVENLGRGDIPSVTTSR